MLSATPGGFRGRPQGARRSATLLLILALTLTGCISVTPPPGSSDPSAAPSRVPVASPSAEPTQDPEASLEPGTTATPRASRTPRPTPPPTASAAPDVPSVAPSPRPTTAGSSAPPSTVPSGLSGAGGVPSAAPSSGEPAASLVPTRTPRPEATAPLLTPGPPRERALAATEVFGFLPYWELSRADTLDLRQLTTLAWFGVEANPRGVLIKETNNVATPGWAGWTSDTWRALQARAQAAGVRAVFTVQRFSWTEGQRRRTVRLLSDPANRMRLTAEVVKVVTDAGADGVNLDFEPMPQEVSEDFTQLVREMRAALNAVDPKLQLTFDVMPGIENYDVAALTDDDAADALFVMGYEYLTGSAARTGSNAPLDKPEGQDLAGDVERILGLVAPDRVILGLPWYGRAWSTVSREPRAQTRSGDRVPFSVTINYRDAIIQAARTGRFYDTVEESAWTAYPSKVEDCQACRVTWRQLWYDDVDATRAKVTFALDQGLRGVGFWALGYQGAGDEMWSVLRLTVGGDRDRRAPSGTAVLDPAYVGGERQGLPVVGARVGLLLTADDGAGSGPAFVRVSLRGTRGEDGELTDGTTFPVTDAVRFDIRTGGPVYDLPLPRNQRPRATPTPEPTPSPSPSAGPSPSLSVVPSVAPGSDASPEAGPSGSPSIDPFWAVTPSPSELPGASVAPSASPTPEPTPTLAPDVSPGRRVIRVQWRDVAGNWSEPVTVQVWFRRGTEPAGPPEPEPSLAPASEPPFVPGESPSVDVTDAPEESLAP